MMGVLGRDFSGFADLDPMLSTVEDDETIASQYIFHKFTTDQLLDSESPQGWIDFGRDLRNLVGAAMTDQQIAALGTELGIMLERDPDGPIQSADVVVTRATGLVLPNGAAVALLVTTTAQIASGPLRRVLVITTTGLAAFLQD